MFGKSVKLFKLFGFEVQIDFSWVVIAAPIAWSLSVGFFPSHYQGLPVQTYWLMGIIGALGLFLSVVFHELCHSLVARSYGIPMKGITLFIFGGVAQMEDEPKSPRAEFMMAIVGPLSSILIALIAYGTYALGRTASWPVPVVGVIHYLSMINGLLGGFNLIPAFPLDGGRVLRSVLWAVKGNMRWATRVSSRIGEAFGVVLILLGALSVIRGNLIGGMWWLLIGMFLRNAAKMSYRQLMVRKSLEGEPIRRFMQPNPVTVPPSISVEELVEDYIYRYHFKMFPVVDSGRLIGCVTTKQVRNIPREEWSRKTVGDLSRECPIDNIVAPDADATRALSIMSRTGNSRLMVMEKGHLLGVITLRDLVKFLALKVDLED